MFKYTKSSILDTLDLIKEAIYYSHFFIQLIYIVYLVFRLYNQTGYLFANVSLLVFTIFYFMYYITTKQEFYTEEEYNKKRLVKTIVKNCKRIIHLYLIVIAVSQLSLSPTNNDNMLLLMTVLMIVGFLASILFDFILMIIDKRIALIKNSFLYDTQRFKKDERVKSTIISLWLKKNNMDIDEILPGIDEEEKIKTIKHVYHKQKNKSRRKRNFKTIKK